LRNTFQTILVFIAFIIGFSSSLHCLGMCGPIALSLPLNRTSDWRVASGAFQYNLGRLVAYSILGLVMGTIGFSVSNIRWMQLLSIVAGLSMIGIAWHKLFTFNFFTQSKISKKILSFIVVNIANLRKSNHWSKLLSLGFLNGFLPCGMVYIGLANAMLQSSPLHGALAMFLFGLGTTPALFSVAFFASKISKKWHAQIRRFIPYLITLLGLLIILRGLDLGIPYLSPKIKNVASQHLSETTKKQTVEIICCNPNN